MLDPVVGQCPIAGHKGHLNLLHAMQCKPIHIIQMEHGMCQFTEWYVSVYKMVYQFKLCRMNYVEVALGAH